MRREIGRFADRGFAVRPRDIVFEQADRRGLPALLDSARAAVACLDTGTAAVVGVAEEARGRLARLKALARLDKTRRDLDIGNERGVGAARDDVINVGQRGDLLG